MLIRRYKFWISNKILHFPSEFSTTFYLIDFLLLKHCVMTSMVIFDILTSLNLANVNALLFINDSFLHEHVPYDFRSKRENSIFLFEFIKQINYYDTSSMRSDLERFSMSFHFNFQLISAQTTRHSLQTNIILCYSCTSLTQKNVFSPWVGKINIRCIAVEEKTAVYYALYHFIVFMNCRDFNSGIIYTIW